jgi:hypothetical protein
MVEAEDAAQAVPPVAPVHPDLPSCCQGGHSFTKRFSCVAPDGNQIEEAGDLCGEYWDEDQIVKVIESLRTYKYVCDVCDKCGFTAGIK